MDVLRALRWMVQAEWPVRLLSPAIGRYNPFHPDFRKDPTASTAACRAARRCTTAVRCAASS